MKHKGILFVPDMVKAIGNCQVDTYPPLRIDWSSPAKSQTRREIKNVPKHALIREAFDSEAKPTGSFFNDMPDSDWRYCPRYQPGDVLYVKELHWRWGKWVAVKKRNKKTGKEYIGRMFKPSNNSIRCEPPIAKDFTRGKSKWFKRPAIFFPKSAARYWIEIISVHAEQTTDLTKADAVAEGVDFNAVLKLYRDYKNEMPGFKNPVDSFASLLDSIKGEGTFKSGAWVMVYKFKRVSAPK